MAANPERADGFYWVNIPRLDSLDSTTSSGGEKFNITNVTVTRKANAIRSPVETGYQVFDNKVIMPIEVTMSALVKSSDWTEVWGILQGIYDERSYNFYTVYTRGEIIRDLMLTEITREETTDKFDAVDLTLHFVQVMIVSESSRALASENSNEISNPSDKKDVSTKHTGQKTLVDRFVGAMSGYFMNGIYGAVEGAM